MFKAVIAFCLSRRALIVFGLLAFAVAGLVAFKKLNIEAYPNPTPVILEITSQAPGLSAEEMERYYTRPTEIGLYSTPGIDVIRSTSFYGLSFVRVTFKYGVDYNFAYAQASIALEQNVNLPGNQVPNIQANSSTGEIYRYQVVGPPHFGIANLRTVEDWIVLRRLLTIPGIAAVNSWGGPTKEFQIAVDPRKLEACSVTLPQLLNAIGNANVNVGGREIRFGQQSVNVRGIGLIDDGGSDVLTQGYKVGDIENVALSQLNGVPVLVKDIGKVSVGYRPRLGILGRDRQDDVVGAIVVMRRTEQTGDMIPKVEAEIAKLNRDGSLPPGVRVVPFYDRSSLVALTTHTVLHNLIFGCVLVFLIQWIFLGNLRSAVVVGLSIPFALFFATVLLVIMGESANLLSVGAVDFGIIVDSAVILVENIFRNFQRGPAERQGLLERLAAGAWGADPTRGAGDPASALGWTDRLRLILISALQVDKAILFSALITVAGFVPLFTMQGVEGQIFGPMARTYGYALAGALLATFTVTPVLASRLLPERIKEAETIVVRLLHRLYNPALRFALRRRALVVGLEIAFSVGTFLVIAPRLGSEFLPHLEEGNFWIRASMPTTLSLEDGEAAARKMRLILLRHPEVMTVVSQHGRPDDGSDASPFSNVELFAPLKPIDEWPKGVTKEKLTEQVQAEFRDELPGVVFNFSQYIEDNIEEAISGVKGVNSVKIVGPNLEVLTQLADQVRDQMSQVRGIADLGIFPVLGQPILNIKVDRTKTARYGLNSGDVNGVVQAAIGGAVATSQDLSAVTNSGALNYSLYTPQVSVSYVPDVFGLNRRTVESLQAQAEGARFALAATHIALSANVVTAAVQEGSLRAQVEATREVIAINKGMLEILRAQFGKGYASKLDVAAQEAQLAQAVATLPPLLKQLAQQRDLLAVLAGGFPSADIPEQFELTDLRLPQELPVSLPSQLVAQRPDVLQAEEALHAASAQIGVAVANRLPSFLLTANAGSMALAFGRMFAAGNGFWGLGAGITQPIFEGGALLHRERAARAAYDQAAEQYRSTVLKAFQNVADTLAALQQDADWLAATAAAKDAAGVTLDLSKRQWQSGYANYLALLSAEQAYQQAIINLVQAQANRFSDAAALFQALGGGWWNREDLARNSRN